MNHFSIDQFQDFYEQSFTKRIVFKEQDSVVFVLNFLPGQALPPHKHPGSDVYLLVLSGSGTIKVDGNNAQVKEGDVVHCGGEEEFAFENTGSVPTSLYVCLNKIPDVRYAKEI